MHGGNGYNLYTCRRPVSVQYIYDQGVGGTWARSTANWKPYPRNVIDVQHVIKIYQTLPLLPGRHYYCALRGSDTCSSRLFIHLIGGTLPGEVPRKVLNLPNLYINKTDKTIRLSRLSLSFWIDSNFSDKLRL